MSRMDRRQQRRSASNLQRLDVIAQGGSLLRNHVQAFLAAPGNVLADAHQFQAHDGGGQRCAHLQTVRQTVK